MEAAASRPEGAGLVELSVADQDTGSTGERINISVRESGQILLNDQEVSLSDLEPALQTARVQGSIIHYSREHPTGEAPPEAEAVMKLIAANRLRIALSTGPEFSEDDSPETPEPRPSNVIEFPGVETFFAKVRRQAAGSRGVSLVRPDLTLFMLPAPLPGSISAQMVAGVKSVVASDEPRNIAAVVSPGALSGDASKTLTVPDVSRQIPFFGLLIGLAYVGHAVWIFEAVPTMLTPGCEDADILIVDSLAIGGLPRGWAVDAGAIMRNPNILAYDRNREKIGALRTAGEVPGRIEFPN